MYIAHDDSCFSKFISTQENQTFTLEVLKLLNFLCKDQDTVMQNYLREQPCTCSINLVEIISVLFHEHTANDEIKEEYLNTLIKLCLVNIINLCYSVIYILHVGQF